MSDESSAQKMFRRLGLAFVVTDEREPTDEERIKASVEFQQTHRMGPHLVACGVGDLTAAVASKEPRDTPAIVAMREWYRTDKVFLALCGGVGSGKTVASARFLLAARTDLWVAGASGPIKTWQYSPHVGLFATASKLKASKLDWRAGDPTYAKALRVRFLVIDDLGAESLDSSGLWLDALVELVNARYENRLRTVITANMTPETLRSRYGERMASRLDGSGTIVACGMRDLRRSP
jgi:DNA replication protein DnaC